MSIPSQHYAELADHSYQLPEKRKDASGEYKYVPVKIDGVSYLPLVHKSNEASGYQGTIYQRQDTGEIVIAHRGTEGGKMFVDASVWNNPGTLDVATDVAMVLGRVNPQLNEAIKLTHQALELAKGYGKNGSVPEVTVTGHSLGGALTQITAYKFGLRGETFNSYGAASLGYGVPEGGHTVINHVMASDVVSAASPHFGQVRVYATAKEIDNIKDGAYTNDSRWWNEDVFSAAVSGIGSHSMHYFTRRDGNGKPDQSVLENPQARVLAAQNAPMIDKYRDHVALVRSGVSSIGDAAKMAAQQRMDEAEMQAKAGEMLVHGAGQAAVYVGGKLKEGVTVLGQQELQRTEMQAEANRQMGQMMMRGVGHVGEAVKDGLDYGARKLDQAGDYLGDQIDDVLDYGRGLLPGKDQSSSRGKTEPTGYRDPEHPDHALFQGLRERLPAGTDDDKIAELALACKQARIPDPDRITSVQLHGANVTVNGAQRWEVAFVDLNSPAPTMAETMHKADAIEQQQLAQLVATQEQQMHQSRSLS